MEMRLPGGTNPMTQKPAGGIVSPNRTRAYVLLFLSLILVCGSLAPALAVTQEDLSQSRQRAEQALQAAKTAEARAQQLAAETALLDDQIDALELKVRELDPQIAKAAQRSKRLRNEVDALRASVEEKQRDIEETEATLEREQGLLDERIEVTYKQGDWYFLDLLLGSQNITDLVMRTDLVRRVIRSNQTLAEGLARTKYELERAQIELQRTLEAVQVKRAEAESVENELRSLRNRRQSNLNAQENALRSKSSLLAETKVNAARLRKIAQEEEQESARIAAELARTSHGSGIYNGVMAWPVPGFYRVTSSFGYRIHPIFHDRRLHTGIDVGKNDSEPINGAAIVASGEGTVVFAGYRSGYGNTVMIDHGNGVVSLYAHQQSGGIKVHVGQGVAKGARIGTVGSTGFSTGPHLHFEVRVNGQPRDPMVYLR